MTNELTGGETPKYTQKELDNSKLLFGKFLGKKFDEVPLTYLDWLSGQIDEDEYPDLAERLKQYLNDQAGTDRR